jgi:hypothetical protein
MCLRTIAWAEPAASLWEMRTVHKILVGKSEAKRLLERRKCSRENNIKMDLKEIGYEDLDRIHMAQVTVQ